MLTNSDPEEVLRFRAGLNTGLEDSSQARESSKKHNCPSLSSLSSSKGVIIRGFDGKLLHGGPNLKLPKHPDTEDLVQVRNNAQIIANQIDEEEWADLVGNENTINEIISKYNFHRNILLLVLILQLAVDICYNFYLFQHRIDTFIEVEFSQKMKQVYSLMKPEQIEYLYWTISGLEYLFCALYYSLGIYSMYRKSIKLLDFFNLICLTGLLSQMMQAYIQK